MIRVVIRSTLLRSIPIKKLPSGERPRERLRQLGPRALSDAELLAVVIGSGTRGQSCLELSHSLLAERGGLAALGRSRQEELAAIPGIGEASSAAIVAVVELARRLRKAPVEGAPLRGREDLGRLAVRELAGLSRERLIVIVLNARRKLLCVTTIADGWSDRAPAPVAEILGMVLRGGGAAFALAHNHPSGDPSPSIADMAATERVARAAEAAGLRLLDHLVVANGEWRAVAPRHLTRETPGPG